MNAMINSSILEASKPTRFPALLVIIFSLVITFSLLSSTLRIPFYLFDDSYILNRAQQLLDQISEGKYFSSFKPVVGETRYFPGFFYYEAVHLQLLGSKAITWHLYHLFLYSTIGVLSTWLAWSLSRSIIPGLVAYTITISTGESVLSSNWINFVTISTFEPPLILFWLLAAFLFVQGFHYKSNRLYNWPLNVLGVLFILWATIFKETSFLIIGATLGLVILYIGISAYKDRRLKSALPVLAMYIFIIGLIGAWGIFVYMRIPKTSAYGGIESLQINLPGIWSGIKSYVAIIKSQSDYIVFGGLSLFVLRTLLNIKRLRSSDAWQFIVFMAGFFQLLTLTIWPYVEARYVQPAYLCFLIVACCEYWRFWILHLSAFKLVRLRTKIAAFASILLMLLTARATLNVVHFQAFFHGSILIMAFLGALWLFIGKRDLVYANSISQAACFVFIILVVFIVIIQSAIMRSFIFTEYECREGLRHQIVRNVAAIAPKDAAVYWVSGPENDGIAWSSDMHFESLWQRKDLIAGPSKWVSTQRTTPRQGDVIIEYTSKKNFKMDGNGDLSAIYLDNGGHTFWVRETADMRNLLTKAIFYPSMLSGKDFETGYQNAFAVVYQVTSATWEPASQLKQEYFTSN